VSEDIILAVDESLASILNYAEQSAETATAEEALKTVTKMLSNLLNKGREDAKLRYFTSKLFMI